MFEPNNQGFSENILGEIIARSPYQLLLLLLANADDCYVTSEGHDQGCRADGGGDASARGRGHHQRHRGDPDMYGGFYFVRVMKLCSEDK